MRKRKKEVQKLSFWLGPAEQAGRGSQAAKSIFENRNAIFNYFVHQKEVRESEPLFFMPYDIFYWGRCPQAPSLTTVSSKTARRFWTGIPLSADSGEPARLQRARN